MRVTASVRSMLETVLPPLTLLASHVGSRVTCQPAAPTGAWLCPSGHVASPVCLHFLICEEAMMCVSYLLLQGCWENLREISMCWRVEMLWFFYYYLIKFLIFKMYGWWNLFMRLHQQLRHFRPWCFWCKSLELCALKPV